MNNTQDSTHAEQASKNNGPNWEKAKEIFLGIDAHLGSNQVARKIDISRSWAPVSENAVLVGVNSRSRERSALRVRTFPRCLTEPKNPAGFGSLTIGLEKCRAAWRSWRIRPLPGLSRRFGERSLEAHPSGE